MYLYKNKHFDLVFPMKASKFFIECADCDIKNKALFGNLCSKSLDKISYNKSCAEYKKGQVLFHEGTRPLGVFCVNKGKIKIYKIGFDGKEQIIQISKPGDLLGYKAMISEETYPVTAEALEDTKVCFVPKGDFLDILTDSSEFNHVLLKEACRELGLMADSLTSLAQKSVRERLAVALLMLKDTYGIDGTDDGLVEINLTREDLANIVGTATETVIRLLHDFKQENLIETKGRKIRVLEPKKLIKIGQLY